MKKVLSFSLWGNIPRYTIGAIKNCELALQFYPDFECWVYIHKDTVPSEILEKLNNMSNTKIILKEGNLQELKPMMWRFLSIDDPEVEINMSRDTDTRILLREKLAVDEWLSSGKEFHIMRDHPHHMNINTPIMGGMFGTKKIKDIVSWTQIINNKKICNSNRPLYDIDQELLSKNIYPIIKNNCFIHSSFGKLLNETHINPFPIPFCKNYMFVGGYVYEDESVSEEHTNIIINAIK